MCWRGRLCWRIRRGLCSGGLFTQAEWLVWRNFVPVAEKTAEKQEEVEKKGGIAVDIFGGACRIAKRCA